MSFIRVVIFAAVLGLVHASAADDSYLRYKEQYGVPNRPLPLADVRDVQSAKLSFYYLHQTTAEDGISAGCGQLRSTPDNRTVQAFCALANWNALQSSNDPEYRATFLRWADELNNSADDGRWIWTIEIPGLGIKPPWISGMTEALAVSVLLRANQLTGDEKYMTTARRAMSWISKPLEDGGCSSRDENGTWIEEYPNASDPNHVFNGHMWAMFGVWDFYRATQDESAKALFSEGAKVIESEIDRYDTGHWIVYSQKNRLDNVLGNYMQFIIEQMRVLGAITKNSFFLERADKWAGYQKNDSLFKVP